VLILLLHKQLLKARKIYDKHYIEIWKHYKEKGAQAGNLAKI